MAATIKIKNSSTAGAAPTSSDLVQGELAVNVTDKRLYTENSGGTVVELGTNPSVPVTFPDGSASAPSLTNSGDTNTGMFFPAADTIAFAEGGTETMRLDSSGNLGLGVTPSSWNTVTPVMQIGTASWYGFGNETRLSTNFYYASGDKYISNGYATSYNQASGQHKWFTAASGTAGNTISFTQAMTLDASGNLGLAASSITPRDSGATTFELYGPSSGRAAIKFTNSTSGTGATDGMFLGYDSSLNFNILNNEAGAILFGTNNTERARITSSGYFKASDNGTYRGSSSSLHEFNQSSNGDCLDVNASNSSYASNVLAITAVRNTTNNSFYAIAYYNDGAAAYKFRVADSGNVTNTNNSYGAISDIKLKENITDATPKLAQLKQIRVVNYNFIGSEEKQLGVIAQELEQIFPSVVEETPDRDAEGNDLGTTTKSVKYSVFVPMLIKAIQELDAKFEAYKATHP